MFKKVFMCLMALVCVVVCANAFGVVDVGMVSNHLGEGIKCALAVAPVTVAGMGSITPEQLNDLKVKFGRIKILTVVVEPDVLDDKGNVLTPGEKYSFAVRRPDRGHIKILMGHAEKKEIDEFAEKAVKNLVVGGDMEALDDGVVYMGVVSKIKEMIAPAASFLANA